MALLKEPAVSTLKVFWRGTGYTGPEELTLDVLVWDSARGRDTIQEDVEKPFDSSTRRVTYPVSYVTKYTMYTKIIVC